MSDAILNKSKEEIQILPSTHQQNDNKMPTAYQQFGPEQIKLRTGNLASFSKKNAAQTQQIHYVF